MRLKGQEYPYHVFRSVLCVCIGNICRSPTAEVILRTHLRDTGIRVASAGLAAVVGAPIDPIARELLVEHGFDGDGHSARQLDATQLHEADLVLAMEPSHVERIVAGWPQARGKVMLLGKWLDERSISDPYRQQRIAFEHAYALIDASIKRWLPYLQPGTSTPDGTASA